MGGRRGARVGAGAKRAVLIGKLKRIPKETRRLPELALNENRRAQAATRRGHFPQDPRALRRLQEIFRRLPR